MVALFLGHLAHAIRVAQRLPEVREAELASQVVPLNDLPIGVQLLAQRLNL